MKKKQSVKEIIKWEKRRLAMDSDKMCDWDFAHDKKESPQAYGMAQTYVENFPEMKADGSGLFLFGCPGSGKSYIAAEIVNELTDRGYKCRFTSLLSILNDLSGLAYDNRRNYMNQLCERDLLVLDDLGAELDSGYSNQVLMQIVTLCHRNLTPIIVTTPYHKETLEKEGGNPKRMLALSRLMMHSTAYTVPMPGERRRRELLRKRKIETMLKGNAPADAAPLFGSVPYSDNATETAVSECLPVTAQQKLDFYENN